MKNFLKLSSLISIALGSYLNADNLALEVHSTGKVGINLPEGSEPSAQVEINGDTKVNGKFHLTEQAELPPNANHGDMVLLNDGRLYIYLGTEWRKILLSVPDSNEKPQTDAGENQFLVDSDNDGVENVTLDGSGTTDDGEVSSYSWEVNGEEVAVGMNPTIQLHNGVHLVTLIATDNYDVTKSDDVVINVRPVAETFESSDIFSTMSDVPAPGIPTGHEGVNVGQINFTASTETARKTKTYNSIAINRGISDFGSLFKISFKAGLSSAEVGDLRIRARVFFDNGSIVNTSYFQLDSNDHTEMELFTNTKSVPNGATSITKVAIQARTQSYSTAAQVGFIDELIVEEESAISQL